MSSVNFHALRQTCTSCSYFGLYFQCFGACLNALWNTSWWVKQIFKWNLHVLLHVLFILFAVLLRHTLMLFQCKRVSSANFHVLSQTCTVCWFVVCLCHAVFLLSIRCGLLYRRWVAKDVHRLRQSAYLLHFGIFLCYAFFFISMYCGLLACEFNDFHELTQACLPWWICGLTLPYPFPHCNQCIVDYQEVSSVNFPHFKTYLHVLLILWFVYAMLCCSLHCKF